MTKTFAPLLGLCICCAAQASAQGTCAPVTPAPDPCVAGHWIGSNSMVEKMDQLISSMPSSVSRTIQLPTMPATLGISIREDGRYNTLPLHQDLTYESVTGGSTTTVAMDLTVATQAGKIWTEGSQMFFCNHPSSGNLHVEATSEDGTRTADIPMADTGAPWFSPDINYTCEGDSLSFTVFLPEPIGMVHYWLTRVPAERFDEEFLSTLTE